MTGQIDPGDPFTPGTRRYEARARLLECLETFIDEVIDQDDPPRRPREYPAWDDLVNARRVWILYGRDGE